MLGSDSYLKEATANSSFRWEGAQSSTRQPTSLWGASSKKLSATEARRKLAKMKQQLIQVLPCSLQCFELQ